MFHACSITENSAVASFTAGLRFAAAEKHSQRPDDYCLVSEDAPNGSWADSVDMAAAAFLVLRVSRRS
jgi:hypothetical protein